MQIDWLIVAAQVVNFLVLVALLRRFLYRPVLDAMARREAHIADRLREAEAREHEARAQQERYDAELAQVSSERETLIAAARREAEQERHAWIERARREVEATEAGWRSDLAREQAAFGLALRREVASAALEVARQVLAELADADLQRRMAERLLARLDALDDAGRDALRADPAGLVVLTGLPLDDADAEALGQRIRDRLGAQVPVRWQHDPRLSCGFALEGVAAACPGI